MVGRFWFDVAVVFVGGMVYGMWSGLVCVRLPMVSLLMDAGPSVTRNVCVVHV